MTRDGDAQLVPSSKAADATPIAVAVVERDGQVLIGQRPLGVSLGGLWEFPGGKIENGEQPIEAAVRECYEEAGVEIEIVRDYGEVIHRYDDQANDALFIHLHFFGGRLRYGEQLPRAPFRWVPQRELDKYEFPAANRTLVEKLISGESRLF